MTRFFLVEICFFFCVKNLHFGREILFSEIFLINNNYIFIRENIDSSFDCSITNKSLDLSTFQFLSSKYSYITPKHVSFSHQKMFFLHLLIFTILPSLSTGVYTYGIIRNASIQLPFALPNDSSHQLRVNDCEDCLCEAYRRGENVYLFTCARLPPGFLCEFYYFMPKRDEIVYPSNDTTIYLIKNETFEEKADCCNTTYLLEQLRNASLQGPLISNSTRFLVFDDSHNIIATVKGEGMYGFNRSDLTNLNLPLIGSSPRTIGYYDGKYYFSEGTNIEVYNATPFSSLYNITLSLGDLTAIRFLNATQMLVGVGNRNTGVYIFKKASTTDQFQSSTSKKISGTDGGETHAIGILNENAFYLGWYTNNPTIALFMRAENNTWYRNNTFNTNHGALTSDIFVDQCQRIWAANPHGSRLFIFDQNGKNLGNVTIGTGLFGLVILEEQNYTLITSHTDSSTPDTNGIYHTHPSVNCRPLRKKNN